MPGRFGGWCASVAAFAMILFASVAAACAQDVDDCNTIGQNYDKNGIFSYDPAYAATNANAELEADIGKADRYTAYQDLWGGADPHILLKFWPGVGQQLYLTMLLMKAVANDNLRQVRTLLQEGADPNADVSDNIMTPLITAARCASPEITVLLLRAGARANQSSSHTSGVDWLVTDTTPLLWASNRGNLDIVLALLRAGANPNAQEIYTDITTNHSKPIGTALLNGPPLPVLFALLHAGAKLDIAASTGETPLMAEAEKGNFDACYVLLRLGVDKLSKDVNGETAVGYAQDWGYSVLANAIRNWTPKTLASSWPQRNDRQQ